MQEMDQRDRELLNALQTELPLISTPFAVIGQIIEMSEKEVLKRTDRLRNEGAIKHLGAIFDSRSLGYRSCLVAARVDEAKIDAAAGVVSAHPGVTQNYRRNHSFNLWFTIAVPPDSRLGLERTIECLGDEAHIETTRMFPTLRLLKSTADSGDHDPQNGVDVAHLTPEEIEAVRALQRDLPLVPRPFDSLGRATNLDGDELLRAAKALHARQQLRRFGAVVQPRKPSFSTTTMGVWVVPSEEIDNFGVKIAENRAVSHCYLRPTYDDWPYNVFTTIHGRSVDECESQLGSIAADTGIRERRALFPTKEYKRTRLGFFSPELVEWEAARVRGEAASAVS